jgi:hypothetical protein
MFYVKSGDLYYNGQFSRSFLPDLYLGTIDEALEFETWISAVEWAESYGLKSSQVLSRSEIPEADFWRGEHHKAREQLREIINEVAFDWDSATDEQKKRFFETVKEISWRN